MSLVQHSAKKDDWLTPLWLVELARELMGAIGLDPSTSEDNPTKAAQFMTTGALEATWTFSPDYNLGNSFASSVWLNPPGGTLSKSVFGTRSKPAVWWAKLMQEYAAGNVREFCFLGYSLNILQTTQALKGDFAFPMDFHWCIFKKRIKFETLDDEGNRAPGPQPSHPNILIYSGRHAEDYSFNNFGQFEALFGEHGECGIGRRYV